MTDASTNTFATVYFGPALREYQKDLEAFEQHVAEPTMSYEALIKDLKAHGKL